jgi:hypothetical protein
MTKARIALAVAMSVALRVSPAFAGPEEPTCMTIAQFIAGLEGGAAAAVTKLPDRIDHTAERFRRFIIAPYSAYPEVTFAIEIRERQQEIEHGQRHLRIRAAGASQFVAVPVSMVTYYVQHTAVACLDGITDCWQTSWHFHSDSGGLAIILAFEAHPDGRPEPGAFRSSDLFAHTGFECGPPYALPPKHTPTFSANFGLRFRP